MSVVRPKPKCDITQRPSGSLEAIEISKKMTIITYF